MSKRINEASNSNSELFGVIPYIDPKRLLQQYSLNKKSDVYSIGVLLWVISSGKRPFEDESYDCSLAVRITQGLREMVIPDTPTDYAKLYTGKYNI